MTRQFDPTPVSTGVVDELLDLARCAPSAGYSQGVHFLVLTDDSLATFWRVTGAGEWFASVQPGVLAATTVVVSLADPAAYTARYAEADKSGRGLDDARNWEVPFWLTDAAMATQNLLLLAEERGLGALYFGIFRNARRLLDELGVPSGVQHLGAVALGWRATDDAPSGSSRTRTRRACDEVVHHGHW